MTLDAIVVENVMIVAVVIGLAAGALTRCFPPTPRRAMKVITLGIHAILSYLTPTQSHLTYPLNGIAY